MAKFMAVDEAKANLLTQKLSQTIFRSPDDFINFYNTGIINKRHDDVLSFVKEITEVYRNVEERGGKLTFISQQEIFLDELRKGLTPWSVIVRLKRELSQLLADETVTQDDVIAFSPAQKGAILKVDEENNLEKISTEKLYSSHDEVVELHEKYSSLDVSEDGDLLFRVRDLANLDDSFITEMRKLLP